MDDYIANTAVRYGFLADATLVLLAYLLCVIGERDDYYSVFPQIPSIMMMTFIFVWLSNFVNIFIFELLKKKNFIFLTYFLSSFAAEALISSISIPLMMRVNHLDKDIIASISFIVVYKLLASFILSALISTRIRPSNHHP